MVQVVDGILESSRGSFVILGGDDDIAVVAGDGSRPLFGVLVRELSAGWDCGR